MELKTVCGKKFLIDDNDYNLIKDYAYHISGKNYIRIYKACTSHGRKDSQYPYLHVFLLNVPDGFEGDHINGDVLDNRRSNLRVVNKGQQNQNRGNWGWYPKGISYDCKKELYRARIQVNGRRIGLGRYKVLKDAVNAYNEAVSIYYGSDGERASC